MLGQEEFPLKISIVSQLCPEDTLVDILSLLFSVDADSKLLP